VHFLPDSERLDRLDFRVSEPHLDSVFRGARTLVGCHLKLPPGNVLATLLARLTMFVVVRKKRRDATLENEKVEYISAMQSRNVSKCSEMILAILACRS
jgi:hypothetical protein